MPVCRSSKFLGLTSSIQPQTAKELRQIAQVASNPSGNRSTFSTLALWEVRPFRLQRAAGCCRLNYRLSFTLRKGRQFGQDDRAHEQTFVIKKSTCKNRT